MNMLNFSETGTSARACLGPAVHGEKITVHQLHRRDCDATAVAAATAIAPAAAATAATPATASPAAAAATAASASATATADACDTLWRVLCRRWCYTHRRAHRRRHLRVVQRQAPGPSHVNPW